MLQVIKVEGKSSAVARLDLLGRQSRAPKTRAASGGPGACSPVRFVGKCRVFEIAFSAFREHDFPLLKP